MSDLKITVCHHGVDLTIRDCNLCKNDERFERIEEYQQHLDEIVVALGSLGLTHSEIIDRIKSLQAENERLRAALKDIAEYSTLGLLDGSDADAMQDAARAALKVIDDE